MPSAAQPNPVTGPALLRGLDHVTPTDTGWVAQCPAWGCPELLDITASTDGHWHLACDGQHTHDEVVDYLQCDTRIDQEDTRRIWRAVMLAPSLEVCEALLRGENVPASQLDQLWVKRLGHK